METFGMFRIFLHVTYSAGEDRKRARNLIVRTHHCMLSEARKVYEQFKQDNPELVSRLHAHWQPTATDLDD